MLEVCFFSKGQNSKSEITESKGFCILNFRLLSKNIVRIPINRVGFSSTVFIFLIFSNLPSGKKKLLL